MDSQCPKCKTVVDKIPGFEWLGFVNSIDLGETFYCPHCKVLLEINGEVSVELGMICEDYQSIFFFNIIDGKI